MNTAAQTRAYRYHDLDVEMSTGVKTGAWQFLTLAAVILLSVLAYVWLTSQTENIEQRVTSMRRKAAVRASEVENLSVKAERFRGGKYIAAAVHRFDLQLHPPYTGQVRRLTLDGEVQEAEYRDTLALRE